MHNYYHLSRRQLESLGITTRQSVERIEQLFQRAVDNKAWSPPKAVIQPGDGRYMMAALAAGDEPHMLAVKTVVLNPDNPKQNLPQINGLVCVLDSNTGLPIAVMDGNWITAVRTAALSATAAKHLAREGASSIAFIGCGVQASSHLNAFAEIFDLRHVSAFGRGKANIEKLKEEATALDCTFADHSDAQSALRDADIVVSSITLDPSLAPFIDANWLKAGAFVAITDFGTPWIEETMKAFDNIIIDDRELEAQTPAKLVPDGLAKGDLMELVLGKAPARAHDTQRTCFTFRAHPMGDLALAQLACEKADELGIGMLLEG